jgi:hypothetical protein
MAYKPNISSIVVDNNSTTTLLTAGSTFTGVWTEALDFPSLVIAAKTDQDGSLIIQFSPDGVNIDSTLTRYYRTTQIEPPHRFSITRKYFRILFTNTSASDQTFLRLQTILGNQTDLNVPADSTMSQDYDATSTRPTNYNYEVALGRRQGATTWNKWGYNGNIGVGTDTVWTQGGIFAKLPTAQTLSIVSSSVNDIVTTGTGAQSIVVYGVDANYDEVIEVVSMNGTTPVVTANTFLGVNRMAVYLNGTGTSNAGKITATGSISATVQATIEIEEGSTQHAFFFTYNNHVCLMDWVLLNANKITGGGGSPKITFKIFVTSLVSNARYEVFRETIDTDVENTVQLNPAQPFVVGEKSLIEIQATTDTNNTVASARFSFVQVRDVNA